MADQVPHPRVVPGGLALVAIVVLAYQPAIRAGWIWDDDYYVTNNKALSRPDGIERIWLGVRDPRT